jgi:hypothetical protein
MANVLENQHMVNRKKLHPYDGWSLQSRILEIGNDNIQQYFVGANI